MHSSSSGFVFCGGMLRSGSTLQYNMAAELVERHKIGKREMWIDDHSGYFANTPGEAGVIVFKSHLLSPQIEERIKNSGSIILTCFRDVRDCVASWQVKTGSELSLEDGLNFAAGAISNFSVWEEIDCPRKLVSRYEDFVGDVAGEILRIAGLIGLDASPSVVAEISADLSVSSLQVRVSALGETDLTRSGPFTWDTKTLVHTDHLNGGIIGRAENELSCDLYEALTETYSGWLLAHGYKLK